MRGLEISKGEMKQKRLFRLSKGVCAAAQTIDQKFRADYGHPELTRAGKFSRFSPYRTALVTLTYAKDGMWQPDHISTVVKHYREWFRRNGKGCAFHYVWVMELTEIGRPHYHMVIWLPKGVRPPFPDQQGWWPHGMTEAKYARSPVGYITKYASKQETKSGAHLPYKARLWGYGGLKMDERGEVAFALAPRWVKKLAHHASHPVKRTFERVEKVIEYTGGFVHEVVIRKSGWLLKAGESRGWWLFSPYEFEGITPSGGIALRSSGVIEMLSPEGDSFFHSIEV